MYSLVCVCAFRPVTGGGEAITPPPGRYGEEYVWLARAVHPFGVVSENSGGSGSR